MSRVKGIWRPILLGALLLTVLVGVAGAGPTERPAALSSQRKLVLAAADFYPTNNTELYENFGYVLNTLSNGAYETFLAPVDFPTHRRVSVDKVELYAYDNNGAGYIAMALVRTRPSLGADVQMALIDTGFSFTDPVNDPRTWQTTAISPNVVGKSHNTFLSVAISDDTNLRLYGAAIYYRVGS